MILIDTDVAVDVWRGLPQAGEWLARLTREQIALPGYVVMELVEGCRSKAELRLLNTRIRGVPIVWPPPIVCDNALTDFARLRFSHGIGLLDMLIAHTAMDLGFPLHTFNQKHYAGIAGLATIQPYVR